MERDPLVRACLLLLAAISLVWLGGWLWQIASHFADVILLFVLAWLVAFVLSPVSRRLQRLGLRPIAAAGMVYAMVVVVLIIFGVLVIPAAVAQLIQLGSTLPALAVELQSRADRLHLELIERGLPEAQLADIYRTAIARAETAGTLILTNTLAIITGVLNVLLRGMIVLIISFYIMLDGDKIGRLLVRALPQRYRVDAMAGMEQIDRTFGGFVRGQLILAAVYALGNALIMQIAGLPFALVLSLFAGIVMIIPIIGAILAVIPPLVIALATDPGKVWWLLLLLLLLQNVVVNILAPRVMGQSVGIHPLLVFAAVLIGTQVASGWGAIFGVPVAAMLSLLLRAFYQRVVLRMPLYEKGVRLSPDALIPAVPLTTPPAPRPAWPGEAPPETHVARRTSGEAPPEAGQTAPARRRPASSDVPATGTEHASDRADLAASAEMAGRPGPSGAHAHRATP